MEVFESVYKSVNNSGCVLALGNFDGVHIGHMRLLSEAKKYAEDGGLSFGVYTFTDSPKFKNADRSLLTDLQTRLSFLHYKAEPDFVYLERFDDVKDFEKEEFAQYIISKFDVKVCFCGENFSFGKGASGNCKDLVALMKNLGRAAVAVPVLEYNGEAVSSTRIRKLLEEGNAEEAEALLLEPYCFTSKVVHGAHLGHHLGYPTINQIIPPELVAPKYGVFATVVIIDGKEYFGVTNFGIKPTVSSDNIPVAETYIIDYNGDAYDKYVTLCFCKMLRCEKKFSSLDELKRNISKNVQETKDFFNEKYKNI